MRLRKLAIEDAPRMLDWMKNKAINKFFKWNDDGITIESCQSYIDKAQSFEVNRHYAVTSDDDLYMGTISLKEINKTDLNAEYAISLHPEAIGKGYATSATTEILKIAFNEIGLNRVFLCVRADNLRAICFYEKYGFIFEGEFKEHIYKDGLAYNLRWYRMLKGEFIIEVTNPTSIVNCIRE